MSSELERIAGRVRQLGVAARQQRDVLGALCAHATGAARQLAAGPSTPDNRALVTRLHQLGGMRDAVLADLDAVSRTMDQLAAHLATPSPGTGSQPAPDSPGQRTDYAGMTYDELVAGLGSNVGRRGSGDGRREVRSTDELRAYFDALVQLGATERPAPGLIGKMYELANGTLVTWRTKSRDTGSKPTVDVRPRKGYYFKVHVNEEGWPG